VHVCLRACVCVHVCVCVSLPASSLTKKPAAGLMEKCSPRAVLCHSYFVPARVCVCVYAFVHSFYVCNLLTT